MQQSNNLTYVVIKIEPILHFVMLMSQYGQYIYMFMCAEFTCMQDLVFTLYMYVP